jgi:hypothetical protein
MVTQLRLEFVQIVHLTTITIHNIFVLLKESYMLELTLLRY